VIGVKANKVFAKAVTDNSEGESEKRAVEQ
jgi:hypothetical protein